MQHLDEGTIHAWLDDALPPTEAAEVAAHVEQCARCAEAVAEARGLMAASSRILSALDVIPGDVIPATPQKSQPARRTQRWYQRSGVRAATAMAAAAVGIFWIVQETRPSLSSTPSESSVARATQADAVDDTTAMVQREISVATSGYNELTQGTIADTRGEDQETRPVAGSSTPAKQDSQESGVPLAALLSAPRPSVVLSDTASRRKDATEPAQKVEYPPSIQGAVIHPYQQGSLDTPLLVRTWECEGIAIQRYNIGAEKYVTLISQSVLPDTTQRASLKLRTPTLPQKSEERLDPRRSTGESSSTLIIPALQNCSPEIKQAAYIDSTASILRWIDLERSLEYLLHGKVPSDTLALVRNTLVKSNTRQQNDIRKK
jgi:hypothetical protein